MKSFIIIFCLFVVPCLCLPAEISDIELPLISCQIDSASRDECIKSSIQQMLPKLQNGQDHIPPIDPYTINERTYEFKRGDIYTKLNLKSGTLRGLSTVEIKNVRTNVDDKGVDAEIDVFVPHIFAEGLYKANGKFNNYKVNAKGLYNITLSDTSSTFKLKAIYITKNGEQYIKIVNFDLVPVIGDLKIDLTGLSPDPELNRLRLDFVNHYWPLIYRDIIPQTKEIWEPHVIDRINRYLLRVPFKKLLHYGYENKDS